MEYVIFIGSILFLLLIYFIYGVIQERKNEKAFIRKLYKNYGGPTDKEYPIGRLETIVSYYKRHRKGFYLDDITWNDLDMDRIFKDMDYTFSAAGEEALYAMLRCPEFDREVLREREKMIDYFMKHEDERVKMQVLYAKIGRTGRYSIFDYMDYLDNLKQRKNTKHYIMFLAYAVAIAVCFLETSVGVVALAGCMIYSIVSYYAEKKEIDPYIATFAYCLRVLDNVDRFEKLRIPIIEEEVRQMKENKKKLTRFLRGAFWVHRANSVSSGDPLEILIEYFKMSLHLDLITFNRMLAEMKGKKEELIQIIKLMGTIESNIAVGAYRTSRAYYCLPEFKDGVPAVQAEEIYHPLIEEPVANSFAEDKSMLLTGSNASGKSTFLKTVALNAILAQTIHTCMAKSFITGMFRVYSSMALRDDLKNKDSYFIVEIKSLKRILDALSEKATPVLCFVDEVLRGTNTVERIAASTEILKSLNTENSLCFAATHDIELTGLLQNNYHNYHFEENILENDVVFNYRLQKGKATTKNAIRLLSILGYRDNIIENANNRAENFVETGNWVL